MFKKNIIGILVAITLLLTACGNSSTNAPSSSNKEVSETKALQETAGTAETEELNESAQTTQTTQTAESTDKTTQATDQTKQALNSDKEIVTANDTMIPIMIQIGHKSFTANLYKNSTTDAFIEQLPMTIDMSELNGNEKYFYLSTELPTNTESIGSIQTGDLMLFGSDCLVLFYEEFNNSYSYTKMGYLENPTELASTLGTGNVQVTFTLSK